MLEIDVEAKAGDEDGTAVLVVAGIVDVLDVEGSKKPAPEMRGVKSFEDFFVAVRERAIAEKESAAAESEIFLVGSHDAVHYEHGACAIVTPLPFFGFSENAEFERPVHFGVGK